MLARTQRVQGNAPQTSETIMEFNYAVHVTKWFTFQPNVQYVVRPGGTGRSLKCGRARVADHPEFLIARVAQRAATPTA